jgi:hypothetical protein
LTNKPVLRCFMFFLSLYLSAYVSIRRQHASAYVSVRALCSSCRCT